MGGRLMVGRSSLASTPFKGKNDLISMSLFYSFLQPFLRITFFILQGGLKLLKLFISLCVGCRLVEKHLGQFVDERKAKQLQERSLPIEGCATVAGRTDKGVTALQQVCSFC
jgi:hypothetical protein